MTEFAYGYMYKFLHMRKLAGPGPGLLARRRSETACTGMRYNHVNVTRESVMQDIIMAEAPVAGCAACAPVATYAHVPNLYLSRAWQKWLQI